jgi:ABC-type phosphate transport system substrate-binding protein
VRTLARIGIAATLVGALFACHALGQTANSFSSVKKLFVESFGAEKQDELLRQSLLARLKKSEEYTIVDSVRDADAILKGNGRIWVKGYFTISSRAPAADRQPVYAGYLSVEITGKGGEPLWSCLVTPSRFSWTNVADNLTQEMLRAKTDTTTTGVVSGVKQSLAQADLNGAGATFPAPIYRLWFQSFQREHPEVRLSYSAVGSELGVRMLVEKEVDCAASDASPQEMSTAAFHDTKFHRFATVLGGVVPIYHVEGLTRDLNFTADTLAAIYLGKVTRWNDAKIRNSNRGVNLPDAPIVVIHRSDGSGSTYAWSDFLFRTNPEWKDKIGMDTKLKWPIGQGAEGSEGVASEVEKTPNAIGYVDFVYAIQHH